jgi:hypothetical protein
VARKAAANTAVMSSLEAAPSDISGRLRSIPLPLVVNADDFVPQCSDEPSVAR